MFKNAIRLDPIPPGWMIALFGTSYFGAERYEDAIGPFKQLLVRAKKGDFNLVSSHECLAATYAMLGQKDNARAHIVELLRVDPNYTLEDAAKNAYFNNQADTDRWINALRKAGLPE